MHTLKKALNPLRKKLFFEKLLKNCLAALSAAAFLGGILLLYSKFFYFEHVWFFVFSIFLPALALGAGYSVYNRPGMAETAAACDALGFKERFFTALETGGDGVFGKLVLNDALITAQNNNLKKMYKIKIPKKILLSATVLFAFFIISGFVPGAGKEELLRRQELKSALNVEMEKIEEVAEKAKEIVNDAQKAEIDKILAELKKDLSNANDKTEASEAMNKAQTKLKRLEKSKNGIDNTAVEAISNAMGNAEQAAEAIQEAQKTASSEESALLNELSEALNSENSEAAQSILEKLAESAVNNAEIAENLKNAASSINGQLADSAREIKEGTQNGNQEGNQNRSETNEGAESKNDESESQSGGEGEGTGQENGSSGAESQSQNQQSGQGANQGEEQGQAGGENGNGQGQSGSGQPGGQGRGQGHIENEMIYSRKAENYSDYEANVEGTENNGGDYSRENMQGMGETGEMLPFKSVYRQYRDEALSNLDDYQIPHGMKEIIKEYFSSLE